MARQYSEKDIVSIKSDKLRVQTRPALYIPDTGAGGAAHIIGEVRDNSLDELATKDSIGSDVTLSYDCTTHEVIVVDNGSGIPHGSMLDACTVLATSGKFNNDDTTAYTMSTGSFGHGLKLPVYLSKECVITSMREGKYLTYVFKGGDLVDTQKGKSKEHGTVVRFTLDERFVRVSELDPKTIQEQYHEKAYCYPDLRLTYILLDNGKEVKNITYHGETFNDIVKKYKPDTALLEVHTTKKTQVLRNFGDDEITEDKVVIDIVLGYSEKSLDLDTDAQIVTFANAAKTYTHGTHLDGAKLGLVKYFREVAFPKLSKKEQETTPIMPSDITAGLCGVVSVKLSKPEFSAQSKMKLTNQEVKFAVRDAVFEELCASKGKVVNEMFDFIKRVTKGRVASKKVRKKDMDNAFSKDRPSEYKPIVYNMKTTSPELLLVEGVEVA